MVLPFAGLVADLQLVGLDQRCGRKAVPVGHGLIVLRRFVHAAVFELDAGILAERHQVGEEEAIGGFDVVLGTHGVLGAFGARGMAGEGQRHVEAAPIVSAAAPFFGAGALGLRRPAVVEEEARIAFERVEHGVVRRR